RAAAGGAGVAVACSVGDCGGCGVRAATSDKVALISGRYYDGPYEYLYVNAERIFACAHARAGMPPAAWAAGVVRELIEAAERALFALENCGTERLLDDFEVDAIERLRTVLAKVRGEA